MDTESGKMPAAGRLKDVLWSSDAFSENEVRLSLVLSSLSCGLRILSAGARCSDKETCLFHRNWKTCKVIVTYL